MTRWGMIPGTPGESIKNLPKHDSPGYNTPVSLTRRGKIPRGVNLARVSYPGEGVAYPAHCNDHFTKTELCKYLSNHWSNFDNFSCTESLYV